MLYWNSSNFEESSLKQFQLDLKNVNLTDFPSILKKTNGKWNYEPLKWILTFLPSARLPPLERNNLNMNLKLALLALS